MTTTRPVGIGEFMSPLWCPIPSAIHPSAADLDERSLAWVRRFELYPDNEQYLRLCGIGSGELAARIMPRATNRPLLQVASDCILWLFAFDDVHCDEGEIKHHIHYLATRFVKDARVAQLGSSGVARGDRYARALADLRSRLSGCASPVQQARWERAVHAYLMAELALAGYRGSGAALDVDDYITIRLGSGGVQLLVALLDAADDVEAPADELEQPGARALTEMTIMMVCCDNDIFSHRKETVRSGDGQNLIDVVAQERGLRFPAAVREVVAIRDRVLARFLELEKATRSTASPGMHKYLDNCRAWIRGNIDWGSRCFRYVNQQDGAALPTNVVREPAEMVAGPLPYSTAAWWWSAPVPAERDRSPKGV